MGKTMSLDIDTGRTYYFDYLRVIATFAVMILHISAQNWDKVDVSSFTWQTFNVFESLVRWGVPAFVMISGALFLNRDIPLKTIYSKYVLRIVTSFAVWSFVYAMISKKDLKSLVSLFIRGNYHMWFLPMIIGLYICVPFFKVIVENDKRTVYFLILAFVFGFALPETTKLVNDFAGELVKSGMDAVNTSVKNMNFHLALGYAGYFVLGYYLNKTQLKNHHRKIIYSLGILGFAATIILDSAVALKTGKCCSTYYGNFNVNILFESMAVFTFMKQRKLSNDKIRSMVCKMSKYSFGAYLVHDLIIRTLNSRFGLNTLSFNPILSVICIGLIVFTVSFVISAILNHIPFVRKYLV